METDNIILDIKVITDEELKKMGLPTVTENRAQSLERKC